jgi:hypothetical protein
LGDSTLTVDILVTFFNTLGLTGVSHCKKFKFGARKFEEYKGLLFGNGRGNGD